MTNSPHSPPPYVPKQMVEAYHLIEKILQAGQDCEDGTVSDGGYCSECGICLRCARSFISNAISHAETRGRNEALANLWEYCERRRNEFPDGPRFTVQEIQKWCLQHKRPTPESRDAATKEGGS